MCSNEYGSHRQWHTESSCFKIYYLVEGKVISTCTTVLKERRVGENKDSESVSAQT